MIDVTKHPSKWLTSENIKSFPSLDALAFTAAGLAAMLIGSWVPDARLTFSGLPFNTILLGVLLILTTFSSIKRSTLILIATIQIPFLLLAITIFWSSDPGYGLDKITTLVITGNISFLFFNTVIERHDSQELIRIIFWFLIFLLCAAILYKSIFGLFNRSVSFLLNGPIVFARLMSIAAVLSIANYKGKTRLALVSIFMLAVFWTESKGPILAILITIASAAFMLAPRRKKIIGMLFALLFLIGFLPMINYLFGDLYTGRLDMLFLLAEGDLSSLYEQKPHSSIGVRFGIWTESLKAIPRIPFGEGLGGWGTSLNEFLNANDYSGIYYPHNLFLELWIESGIIIGTLAILPFIFFFTEKNIFTFVAFSLLLSQMFSGDLGDARMLLIFSLLAISFGQKTPNRNPTTAHTASRLKKNKPHERY